MEQAGVKLPADVSEAGLLTTYAVQARYPDWDEAATEQQYKRALTLARKVTSWAEKFIQG